MFVRQPVSFKKARRVISFVEEMGVVVKFKDFKSVEVYIDREMNRRYYVFHVENCKLVIVNIDKQYFPYIESINCLEGIPTISVDEGAAKAVLRGADLMAPGISEYDEFNRDQLVCIKYRDSPLAVGIALFSSNEIRNMAKGKVVKILHYKGDKIWKRLNKNLID